MSGTTTYVLTASVIHLTVDGVRRRFVKGDELPELRAKDVKRLRRSNSIATAATAQELAEQAATRAAAEQAAVAAAIEAAATEGATGEPDADPDTTTESAADTGGPDTVPPSQTPQDSDSTAAAGDGTSGADSAAPEPPKRPAKAASVTVWRDYIAAIKPELADEVAGMDKDELQAQAPKDD